MIALLAAPALATGAAAATSAGTLQCETDGGLFHFGSTRAVTCVFHGADGRNEAYAGQIGDLHTGLRSAGSGVIVWAVDAARAPIPPGELAGSYADAGGMRRPVLVDGSDRTLALRPAATGRTFNVATGVGTLDLSPLMAAPRERGAHHRTIPAVGLAEASPSAHYGCGSYVHVAAGDTLSAIAHRCRVSLEALLAANPDIRDEVDPAFEAVLEESGDHTIRVYLLGADADEGRSVDYRLDISVVGQAAPFRPAAAGDVLVPGTGYHATGEIECVDGGAPALCPFGVVRHGNGTADVTITRPDGRERTIFFEKGEAIGTDVSPADRGEFAASRSGDVTVVTVGEARYEIVDAIVFGG